MRGIRVTAAAACLAAASASHAAENGTNYCNKQPDNQKWAKLAAEHKDSDVWQRLYALRIGLCAMVAHDSITLDRATAIFERQRKIGIQQIRHNAKGDRRGA